MAVTIQTRRDEAADWAAANPTLALGEIGIETDTNKAKYGDGFTLWNDLDYFIDAGALTIPGTDGQTLRYEDSTSSWEATSNLVVDDAGNVGIGTPSPVKKLQVNVPQNSAGLRVQEAGGVARYFEITPSSLGGMALVTSAGADTIFYRDTVDESMRIDSAGNVGINTGSSTVVGAKLFVNGGDITTDEVDARRIGFNTANTFVGNNGKLVAQYGMTHHANPWELAISGLQAIVMYTGSAERMRIDAAGAVGIENTAPATYLDIRQTLAAAPTYKGDIRINRFMQDANEQGGIEFHTRSDGGGFGSRISGLRDSEIIFEGRVGSATWTERMRIDSAGGLLVGLTTGGQGAGSINVSGGYYVNGTPVVLASALVAAETRITDLENQLAALVSVAQSNGWAI